MGFDIINKLKKEKGLTNAQISAMSGVTLSTLDKITAGANTNPKLDTLQAICRVLGCTLNDFIDDKEIVGDHFSLPEKNLIKKYRGLDDHGKEMVDIVLDKEAERVKSEATAEQEKPTTKIIPLYLSPAAAGYTSPILGEDYEDYEVPASADADYAVRIDGDSMEPYIKDKSVVLVKKTVDLKDGDVGIFSVDNDMYCKQYCQDYVGNVYLFSLNRKRKDADITIWNNSGQTLWCFGKVLMKKRVPLPMGRDI